MELEDYQKRLEALISPIRMSKAPESSNRLKGVDYYGSIPSGQPQLPRSNFGDPKTKEAYQKAVTDASITNDPEFYEITRTSHTKLLANWKIGGIMTSCNGFVGKAAFVMGAEGFGGFETEQMLIRVNKGHCWVRADSGEKPRYGDIFEMKYSVPGQNYLNIHMGVSLYVEGSRWFTAEAGQGGPRLGVDLVARCGRNFPVHGLLGWVDMKTFLSDAQPIPDWLPGAWMIYAGDKTYVYNFHRHGEVTEHVDMGLGVPAASQTVIDTGKWSLAGNGVQIRWNGARGVETLSHDREGSSMGFIERANGVAADGTPMRGVRL